MTEETRQHLPAENKTTRRRRGIFGCLLRTLAVGIGLILLAGVALFIAYNSNLYRGQPPAQGALVIRGGALFDGTGGAPVENALIVIQDDRVACVGAECRLPAEAQVIDAAGLAILPGLIDLHVHFGAPAGEDLNRSFPLLMWDYARQQPGNRRAFHEAGVTTIRSVGDVKDSILSITKQVDAYQLAGPRIFAVGPLFTAPEGHPAGTIYRGNPFLIENATRQVTDPEVARAAVRQLASEGVRGIKAVYDEGDGQLPRLSLDVLQAIVEEAHRQGLWVAVHTGSAQEVHEAVLAGADTIEHGVTDLLDADTVALMQARNVTYVPTLAMAEALVRLVQAGEWPEYYSSEAREQIQALVARMGPDPMETVLANVNAAANGGVHIGAGTDTQGSGMAFGASLHRELELLVQAGLSPTDALLAATQHAATALRAGEDLGTIEPGKIADLVLVAGQPWESINDIRNVRLVIQNGQVLVDKRW